MYRLAVCRLRDAVGGVVARRHVDGFLSLVATHQWHTHIENMFSCMFVGSFTGESVDGFSTCFSRNLRRITAQFDMPPTSL